MAAGPGRRLSAHKTTGIWTKASADGRQLLEMRFSLLAPGQPPPTDWDYEVAYTVRRTPDLTMDLAGATWADWDHRGDLVFVRDGRLFRQRLQRGPKQLADFNDHRPQHIIAPLQASRW